MKSVACFIPCALIAIVFAISLPILASSEQLLESFVLRHGLPSPAIAVIELIFFAAFSVAFVVGILELADSRRKGSAGSELESGPEKRPGKRTGKSVESTGIFSRLSGSIPGALESARKPA
jgi:hypothetical protein